MLSIGNHNVPPPWVSTLMDTFSNGLNSLQSGQRVMGEKLNERLDKIENRVMAIESLVSAEFTRHDNGMKAVFILIMKFFNPSS